MADMRRRDFITLLGGAQQRVGALLVATDTLFRNRVDQLGALAQVIGFQ